MHTRACNEGGPNRHKCSAMDPDQMLTAALAGRTQLQGSRDHTVLTDNSAPDCQQRSRTSALPFWVRSLMRWPGLGADLPNGSADSRHSCKLASASMWTPRLGHARNAHGTVPTPFEFI